MLVHDVKKAKEEEKGIRVSSYQLKTSGKHRRDAKWRLGGNEIPKEIRRHGLARSAHVQKRRRGNETNHKQPASHTWLSPLPSGFF